MKKKKQIQLERDLHIRKAEVFYTDLKKLTAEAKTNDTVEVISFDYQQNLPLPQSQLVRCIIRGSCGCITFVSTHQKLVSLTILCITKLQPKKVKMKLSAF